MIVFRHVDTRFPFLWETPDQAEGRWNRAGDGPVHYFADTPHGAWAEFLRHEEIRDPGDLRGVSRSIWAIELHEVPGAKPPLPSEILTGGRETYATCQREAENLRTDGATGLIAASAALAPGGAAGWRIDGGRKPAHSRDGLVVVLFGQRPDLVGWEASHEGRPDEWMLMRVRHFGP